MEEIIGRVHETSDRGGDRAAAPAEAGRPEWVGRVALMAVLVLGLVLRMGWPALAEFKRDEATVLRRALAIAYEGELPATGVATSMGTANLPLTLYLTAIPLRLWRDPVAVVLFTGLLNGLAVLACYAIGRACFGRAVGLVAAFLFAVNPWAVLYGRKIWSQNLPLVTLGFFAALFATFVRGKRWALVGAFVGLAALVGLHLGGLAFVPILLVPMVLYRKQVAWRPLVVGMGLAALLVAPYVVHDALHDWSNVRGFLGYAGGESHLSWDALRYAFFLTGSAGIHGMAGGLQVEYLAGLPNGWWLNWVMMGLFALALVYGLVQIVRGPVERRRSFVLLLLWFAVPIAMQSRPSADVYPHYFILLYPVQFLFIAVLLVDGVARRRSGRPTGDPTGFPKPVRSGRPSCLTANRGAPPGRFLGRRLTVPALLLAVGLVLWGSWQVAVSARLLVFMDRHPTTGGYGIPLKYTRAAAQEARRLARTAQTSAARPEESEPVAEIVVLSAGVDPAVDETAAVFEALLFGHPHRLADGRWALPVPDSARAVYVAGPVDEVDGASDLWPVVERLGAMEYVQPGPTIALPDGWRYLLFFRDGPDREDVLAGLSRFDDDRQETADIDHASADIDHASAADPKGFPKPLGSDGDVAFANGTVFMGYSVPETVPAGGALEVWVAWWARSLSPPGSDYHFFTHLLDEGGGLRGQCDVAGFPTASWRAGDLVLNRFVIPVSSDLSPGPHHVLGGLYTYPDVVNVSFLDVAGNPAGDRVMLGEVEVR